MSRASDYSSGWAAVPLRVRILVVGALILSVAAWAWRGRDRPMPAGPPAPARPLPTRLEPDAPAPNESEREAPPMATTYSRDIERPKAVQNPAQSAVPDPEGEQGAPGTRARTRGEDAKRLPEVLRMPVDSAGARSDEAATLKANAPEPPHLSAPDVFAPFGRLVKCQLVNTVDSLTARAEPIVALVTQDVSWNGNVIIPAGTEAFSYARPDPVIDASGVGRLVDTGDWTLVLTSGDAANGRELHLKGRAVDRRELVVSDTGTARSWGIDDGADGLVGYTLSTVDNTEAKLFAASALSGAIQGFGAVAERQQTAPGLSGALGATQTAPTLGNALTASATTGSADYLNQVVSRIRDALSKRGTYVRVPAGKTFYLFVEQTIDPRAAAIGLNLPSPRTIPP